MDMLSLGLSAARLIGWMLVQFLWQACAVGLLYAAGRALLPRGEARYRCGMAALLLLALCPVLTLWRQLDAMRLATGDGGAAWLPVYFVQAGAATEAGMDWHGILDAALPWLVLAWLLGVLLLSVRAWRQWRRLQRMVKLGECLPQWQVCVVRMAARFGLRRQVTVLRSWLVDTPMLVGWLRPVILMPAAVAMSFPAAQLEWILAHELAHLRRWDPLANLFQVILETLYFYHPAVHWISREVRNERELCCDQLALAIKGGSRREFAAALAGLGELREYGDRLRLAASDGELLERVRYLAAPVSHGAATRTPARHAVALLGALLLVLVLHRVGSQAGTQDRLLAAMMSWHDDAGFIQAPVLTWRLPAIVPSHLPGLLPLSPMPATDDLPPINPVPLRKAVAKQALVLRMSAFASPPKLAVDVLPYTQPAAGRAPQVRRASPPLYPAWALQRGIEGRVTVAFSLATDGRVRDLKVLTSIPSGVFDQAVLAAVSGWKYVAPVAAPGGQRFQQTLVFNLHDQADRASGELSAARRDCRPVTGSLICRHSLAEEADAALDDGSAR